MIIKENNDLDMIIKENNDLDMIIEEDDPDRIINNKVSSNRVTEEKNDLDKINKEETDQNSVDKFIKEDVNLDSANNKDKENKMECDLDGGITEGCIEVMQDDNRNCEHGQGSNIDIIFIEQKDITKLEQGEGISIDIIEGLSKQEDNIDCEHADDPNIGVFININEEERNECELGNNRHIDAIKDFIEVMHEDKGWYEWVWSIAWSPCFKSIRRVWRTARRRWFVWNGWFCSKWKTKSGMTTRTRRTQTMPVAGKRIKVFQTGDRSAIGFEALDDSVLSIDNQVQQPTREEASSKLAHTRGCAGLVGVNVVWLFAHDMKHKKLILADYFDARRLRSVRASKSILRHVNQITGIKVTGKVKMEDLANRIAEISHMSRCTSDAAVYRPTLKITLHLRVLSRLQSTPMEIRFVLLRVRIRKPVDRIRKTAGGRIRKTAYRIRKPTAGMSRP
jgi:hypothetical protein